MSLEILSVRARLALLCVLVTVSSLTAQCGTVGTVVSFGLGANGVWTKAGSPYCVNVDATIAWLEIHPGVEVRVAPNVHLNVTGELRALGTWDEPIVFTSQLPPTTAGNRWSGLRFTNASANCVLSHCRIENARNSGVRVQDTALLVSACRFADNIADGSNGQSAQGGALNATLNSFVTMTVVATEMRGNTAAGHGGAIHAVGSNGVLAMSQCRVEGNTANPGCASGAHIVGGGARIGCTAVIDNCLFAGNATSSCGFVARADGGGIYSDGPLVTISRTVVSGNTAYAQGCGVWFWGAYSPGTTNCYGGGIFQAAGVLTATNVLVCCNAATYGCDNPTVQGGGVFIGGGSAAYTNCTIARNNLAGLHCSSGSAILNSCIVYENGCNGGSSTCGSQVVGAVASTYSCIQSSSPYAGQGNIAANPSFVGSACSPASFEIFELSPCRDAGDPASAFDDACVPSPIYGPSSSNRCDQGASGGAINDGFASPALFTTGANEYGALVAVNHTLKLSFASAAPPCGGSGNVSLMVLLKQL